MIAIALSSYADDFPYFLIFSIKKRMVKSFVAVVLPLPSQADRWRYNTKQYLAGSPPPPVIFWYLVWSSPPPVVSWKLTMTAWAAIHPAPPTSHTVSSAPGVREGYGPIQTEEPKADGRTCRRAAESCDVPLRIPPRPRQACVLELRISCFCVPQFWMEFYCSFNGCLIAYLFNQSCSILRQQRKKLQLFVAVWTVV